jgi:hypothetical protein
VANQWLRLWHDMPTDPKWRTIAKASGHRIGDVMAVYCHLLVCASNATERGRTQSFCSEDVASALDMETEQVEQIIAAMQGRVLESDTLMGWEKRQVAREDGAAERSKAWREAQKLAKAQETNATERNRTQSERERTPDKIRLDKDKDKDKDKKEVIKTEQAQAPAFVLPDWINAKHWDVWHQSPKRKKATRDQKQLAVDKLAAWREAGQDHAGALENAAVGGNQGLFLPNAPTRLQQPNKQQALEDRNRAVARKWAEDNRASA